MPVDKQKKTLYKRQNLSKVLSKWVFDISVFVITYHQSFHQLIIMFALHLESTELDRHRLQFPRQADISGSGDFNDLLQLVVLSLKGFIICRQFLHVCVERKQSGHFTSCAFTSFHHAWYGHVCCNAVSPPPPLFCRACLDL